MSTVGFLSPTSEIFHHIPLHRCSHRRCDSSPSSPPKKRALISPRCSGEEIPVETTKKTPSLISAINVQKAIRGIEITNVDHYVRLGIARGDSYDKVNLTYQKMCEEVMNQELDEEEVNKRLDILKESYEILSSEEERRLYDWSLARNEMPDRYVWPFEVDITQTPTQPPPPPEPEDIEPTKLVGYFFLGWFVLSVILAVTINR
uniref:Chaperone DnaJ-domain superfamily protein n=1 Tax=Masdevallia picturata TaxID=125444 RepID=A0A0F7H1N4_9ASPA